MLHTIEILKLLMPFQLSDIFNHIIQKRKDQITNKYIVSEEKRTLIFQACERSNN